MPDAQTKLILLLSGLATSSAFVMFLAPTATMKLLFGRAATDSVSILIARHWGLLISLIGALLIYAAYHVEMQASTLVIAGVEKAAFALGIVMSPDCRNRPVAFLALADAMMAIACITCLLER
jgi:hypothetical protein